MLERLNSEPAKRETKPASKLERFGSNLRRKILIGAVAISSIGAFEKGPGLTNYHSAVSFNEAFRTSRGQGEKEFLWKGKRYNTDLVDKEFSDLYLESKDFLEKYYQSDYFKQKNKPVASSGDSSRAKYKVRDEGRENPRFQFLDKRALAGDFLTAEEAKEYIAFIYARSPEQNPEKMKKYLDSILTTKLSSEQIAQAKVDKLHIPSYFSITTQKGNRREDGMYYPENDKVFISGKQGVDRETTPVHELAHKATRGGVDIDVGVQLDLQSRAIESIAKNHLFIKWTEEGRKDIAEWIYYMSTPTEIDARQNSTRFWLSKHFPHYKINAPFTEEQFIFLQNNLQKLPYDIKQLLEIFPVKADFVDNMNKY